MGDNILKADRPGIPKKKREKKMHLLAATGTASTSGLVPYIPLLVAGLFIFLAYKQGRVGPPWIIVLVLAGICLMVSTLGPNITQILQSVSKGYL